MGGYGVRARECAWIRRFIDSEQRVAVDLPCRGIERSLCEKLQVTNETFVRQRGVIEGRIIALGNNREHVANKLDRDDETVGALRHGSVDDMQRNEALLFLAHLDAQIVLDNLKGTARKRVLLAIELLDLEQQRILTGDALALALQSKADMVCESDENLIVDVDIELSTEHLNNVLGNHEVDGGDGLQKMCQAVNRTRILRSSLLQRIGLFDRCLIDSVAGMAAEAEASADDDELGAIVRSDHCDVIVENALDNHGTHHKNLLGKPDDRLFNSNRAGSMLTKSRVLRTLAHDNEDRGIEAGGADRVEIDLDEGLARVDMVTLGNKRMEALALKLNSVDSDMQHHLSRAVVGHDAQRVLSRKQGGDGAGNRSAHRSLLGNHGNAIAHGTAAKSGVIGIF